MIWYRIETKFAVGAVSVDSQGIITNDWTAPIFRKLIGQDIRNFLGWSQVVTYRRYCTL